MNLYKKVTIYTTFAIIGTILVNLSIGTNTLLLWVLAFMSIFNLHFTTRKSARFIVPDMIWIFGMLYIALTQHLYYDVIQYVYYFVIGIIQFKSWTSNSDFYNEAKIRRIDKSLLFFMSIILIGLVGLFSVFGYFIGDAAPFLDSINTSLAFTGAYLLAKRYYEAQYLFLLSNGFTAILYLSRGIPSVTITMFLFMGYSIIALYEWKKELK